MAISRLASLCFDVNDPAGAARFWASVLNWETASEADDPIVVRPTDGTGFSLRFAANSEPKSMKNVIHVDLVSESVEHQRVTVDRLIELGSARVDVGQPAHADHVVLADPEGNEFCVVLRSEFLGDAGFLGAVVFEPADPTTGYFWGKAIGWPVVYDQDGDVAIRAPDGRGPFIAFGPPRGVQRGETRLRLGLASKDDQLATEIDRFVALGARRIDHDVACARLADPDGNEFLVSREP